MTNELSGIFVAVVLANFAGWCLMMWIFDWVEEALRS